LTEVVTPTAVAVQTHYEQQPRDFVHLTAATTALHSSAQQSLSLSTRTLCNFVQSTLPTKNLPKCCRPYLLQNTVDSYEVWYKLSRIYLPRKSV